MTKIFGKVIYYMLQRYTTVLFYNTLRGALCTRVQVVSIVPVIVLRAPPLNSTTRAILPYMHEALTVSITHNARSAYTCQTYDTYITALLNIAIPQEVVLLENDHFVCKYALVLYI